MGARHRDAVAKAHQLGEHLRAGHHREVPAPRLDHFGVVGSDGGRHDDDLGAGDMSSIVADIHVYPEPAQACGHRAGRAIRAGDFESEGVQHLRDAPHSRAADANEMDPAHAAHA